jgi:hypothetical protein
MPIGESLETVFENLGLNLYIFRIYRQVSVEAAAKAVEISPGLLIRIENGLHPRCSIGTIICVCAYYDIALQAAFETF